MTHHGEMWSPRMPAKASHWLAEIMLGAFIGIAFMCALVSAI